MAIVVDKNDSLEDAIRKWKREVSRSNILNDLRKKEYYVKPGDKKREKRKQAKLARSKGRR